MHVPVLVMRLVAGVMAAVLPNPPVTPEQVRMVATQNIAELRTVEDVFGFKPRPLQGSIDYIKGISFWEGLRIAMGFMPMRIRDH